MANGKEVSKSHDSDVTILAAGVPAANVIVGPQDYRGKGVVQGTTSTPKGVDHWGALTFAGTLIK